MDGRVGSVGLVTWVLGGHSRGGGGGFNVSEGETAVPQVYV